MFWKINKEKWNSWDDWLIQKFCFFSRVNDHYHEFFFTTERITPYNYHKNYSINYQKNRRTINLHHPWKLIKFTLLPSNWSPDYKILQRTSLNNIWFASSFHSYSLNDYFWIIAKHTILWMTLWLGFIPIRSTARNYISFGFHNFS